MKTTAGVRNNSPIRHATLRSIGIRWHYWLIPTFFAIAGFGSFVVIRVEPENLTTLFLCGAFFSAVSTMGFLWPPLRVRESHDVRFASVQLGTTNIPGMILPTSRVKSRLLLAGGSIFGLMGLAAFLFAASAEDRVKGCIACAFYFMFVLLWLWGNRGRQPGILLSQGGLLWQEIFLPPCFIPWEQLQAAKPYLHRDSYSSTPSIGVRVETIEALELSPGTKKKLAENLNRFGWHLYYHAESLLVAVETAAKTISFYASNPSARAELATGAGLHRVSAFDNEANLNGQIWDDPELHK